MFSYQRTLSHYSPMNVLIWLSLALQAGAINTGGFLSCQRFVSHVTGFGSLVGSEAAKGNWLDALAMMFTPVFFIVGSMISAFIIDQRIQTNRRPMYPVVMLLIALVTFAVTILGETGYFGEFGAPFSENDYLLLAALCLICGLQNATITSAFGAIVRTTHLTGISTDLGIGLIRVMTHAHKIQPRNNEIRANWMRAGIIIAFIFGSFISALFYLHFHFWGFLLPCFIATVLFIRSLTSYNHIEQNQND